MDVARDAMQMTEAKVPLAEIRKKIEAKYLPTAGTMTPAPPVPTKK